MKAIVLAAGKSTRMGCNENKCIMPLDNEGHTMLGRVLDQLKALSVWPVVVVGYQAERIMQRYYAKASFVYNAEYERTGSLYSLWLASQVIAHLGTVVMLASGSNLITDNAIKNLFYTMTAARGVAAMYPYPHHLKGVRNIYHRLERKQMFGESFVWIAESAPHDNDPNWYDYAAYSQFAVVGWDRLDSIPNYSNWRTANSGWALTGCIAMEMGAEDTLDVNTPHDFELAKEMFGYV